MNLDTTYAIQNKNSVPIKLWDVVVISWVNYDMSKLFQRMLQGEVWWELTRKAKLKDLLAPSFWTPQRPQSQMHICEYAIKLINFCASLSFPSPMVMGYGYCPRVSWTRGLYFLFFVNYHSRNNTDRR